MARLTTGRAIAGARLPLVLLLVVFGVVAGTSIWLTLVADQGTGGHAGSGPRVQVRLDSTSPKGAPAPKSTAAAHRLAKQTTPEPAGPKQSGPKPVGPKQAGPKQAGPKQAGPKPVGPKPVEPKPVEPKRAAPKQAAAESRATAPSPGPPAETKSAAVRPERPKSTPPGETTPKRVATRAPQPDPSVSTPSLPIGLTLPRIATGPPLSIAPDPSLVQRGEYGLLPIIGADGRKPWRVYARPFDRTDKRPRIAIVVTGLGHSSQAANSAIQGLPGAVTLAFSPYSRRLDEWIRLARAAGHEVLIHVPMEPIDFPDDDPGPQTLLTSLSPSDNQRRLMWALGRATGYVGVVSHKGSRFTADSRQMRPVLAALNRRGLLFVDGRTSARSATAEIATEIGLPWTIGTHRIDKRFARDPIDARLRELETVARKNGRAVGIGSVSPVMFERIAAWVNGVARRGFVLAPVSSVVAGESGG